MRKATGANELPRGEKKRDGRESEGRSPLATERRDEGPQAGDEE